MFQVFYIDHYEHTNTHHILNKNSVDDITSTKMKLAVFHIKHLAKQRV